MRDSVLKLKSSNPQGRCLYCGDTMQAHYVSRQWATGRLALIRRFDKAPCLVLRREMQ